METWFQNVPFKFNLHRYTAGWTWFYFRRWYTTRGFTTCITGGGFSFSTFLGYFLTISPYCLTFLNYFLTISPYFLTTSPCFLTLLNYS
jgi:hypothetical protein